MKRTKISVTPKTDKLFISRVNLNGITPFLQQPSSNSYGTKQNPSDKKETIKADDLFSRFTADIIKKDVPFTR